MRTENRRVESFESGVRLERVNDSIGKLAGQKQWLGEQFKELDASRKQLASDRKE